MIINNACTVWVLVLRYVQSYLKFRLARRLLFNYFVGSDDPTEDGVTGTTTSANSDTTHVVVIVVAVIAVVALITAAVIYICYRKHEHRKRLLTFCHCFTAL